MVRKQLMGSAAGEGAKKPSPARLAEVLVSAEVFYLLRSGLKHLARSNLRKRRRRIRGPLPCLSRLFE
jgi:hypothetical protein